MFFFIILDFFIEKPTHSYSYPILFKNVTSISLRYSNSKLIQSIGNFAQISLHVKPQRNKNLCKLILGPDVDLQRRFFEVVSL
jgi:hypothetical protein